MPQISKKRNIYFANLVQNTKELKLDIPWRKLSSRQDPLLYAKAEIGDFVLHADLSLSGDTTYYGFNCYIKPVKIQIFPNVYESQEVYFDGGFYLEQKAGLKWYMRLQKVLANFKVS